MSYTKKNCDNPEKQAHESCKTLCDPRPKGEGSNFMFMKLMFLLLLSYALNFFSSLIH